MENLASLARPYAKAAFEFAQQTKKEPLWDDVLMLFSRLFEDNKIISWIKNPNITEEQVLDFLKKALDFKLDPPIDNFLMLLLSYKRLNLLPQIAEQFQQLRFQSEGIKEAKIISTYELSKEQREALKEKLEKRFNADILLEEKVDKTLLGGAVIQVGDKVLDGSGRKKLKVLRDILRGNNR